MPNRYLVTYFLCMWVFSICAPSVFYFSIEDPGLIISISTNEEEPGEPENQDCMEGTKALPEIQHFCLISPSDDKTSPPESPAGHLEIVFEVVLPPPEINPSSQPEFFRNV